MQHSAQIDVLYEEGAILVLNKPAGLPTQAPPGIASLESCCREWIRHRDQKGENFYLAVTHRLDRPVSGAIIFAKNIRAARRISEQFATRTIQKTYWTIVQGELKEDQGEWTDYLRKIPHVARSEISQKNHPDAKEARLNFKVLQRRPDQTLLQINLETGRSHQIRVQCAARNHPIVGDELYGSVEFFGPNQSDYRKRSIALHAHTLIFQHPMLHDIVNISSNLPESWQSMTIVDQHLQSLGTKDCDPDTYL